MMYGVLSVLSTFIQPWPRNSLQELQRTYIYDSDDDDVYMLKHSVYAMVWMAYTNNTGQSIDPSIYFEHLAHLIQQ